VTGVVAGVALGLAAAAAQWALTAASLRWAKQERFFVWLWLGGIVVRLAGLMAVAFWVAQLATVSLAATLITMVVSTTVLLVAEAHLWLKG